MPTTRFRFEESWQLAAAPAAVAAALADVAMYPRWWPQIRAVARLDEDRAWVVARSALPYRLDLVLTREVETVDRLQVAIAGDLVGRASFDLRPQSGGTAVEYRQEVVLGDPMANAVARLPGMTAVLRWNHARMMRRARHGLLRYLDSHVS